jgi:alpha-tubulin suppressor-like RCC1 family protein
LRPVAVAGGLTFKAVSAGSDHTCGVTTADQIYCWGANIQGELGDGSTAASRQIPTLVVGGLRFRQIGTVTAHTCGVTTADEVYCWGSDRYGQIGDNSDVTTTSSPKQVAGTRLYHQVFAGGDHSCALTSGRKAFCWGEGAYGQIGDGKGLNRFTSRAVIGGLLFDRLALGGVYT